MHNKKGGLIAKIAIKQNKIFNFYIFLFLWIAGIFLLTNTVQASAITPQSIIELTNQERARYGLPELIVNQKLNSAATNKAKDLLTAQTFSHNFNDKKFSQWIRNENYEYSIVGENLAINFNNTEPLFNAWLASPTHKKNILYQDYQEVGVAILNGNWLGEETTLVVQLFGTAPNSNQAVLKPAVAGELFVPGSMSFQSSIFNASNLSENYLQNIIEPNLKITIPTISKLKINYQPEKNTALRNYLLVTVQLLIIYMSTALLLILIYFYIDYFSKLTKKLNLLNSTRKI